MGEVIRNRGFYSASCSRLLSKTVAVSFLLVMGCGLEGVWFKFTCTERGPPSTLIFEHVHVGLVIVPGNACFTAFRAQHAQQQDLEACSHSAPRLSLGKEAPRLGQARPRIGSALQLLILTLACFCCPLAEGG